jgi:mannose-1-phosphate guanylyltransferase/mannose-6-phosphate isomerase
MMIIPVILSGGSGSRLWPLSRELYPKQLLPLVNNTTMLQDTALRTMGIDGIAPPLVVCNEEHRFMVAEQLRQIGLPASSIVLEPCGRNTAPAIAVAALEALAKHTNPVLLVLPADHVINDAAAFKAAVVTGAELAAAGKLATFGIVPTTPETGYGYIRADSASPLSIVTSQENNHTSVVSGPKNSHLSAVTGHLNTTNDQGLKTTNDVTAYAVAEFVEKPDRATAEQYLQSGDYYWNSGMFMFTAQRCLEELKNYAPEILTVCRAAFDKASRDSDFTRLPKDVFASCPSDSIDYAVMEKTADAVVIPLDAGWNDVGAWSALWEIGTRDAAGNVVKGDVVLQATSNCLINAGSRLVATVGVSDHVIVETADAVLVAHKDRVQDVKSIVNQLNALGRKESVMHRKAYRPWGAYESVDCDDRFQVKRITVNPGASLSLQMHHHRAEHWIVVKGTAKVTRGDEVILLSENQSVYIPLGVTHRLENPGVIPLELIEVQSGSYLGEDDIVRFEDVYGR